MARLCIEVRHVVPVVGLVAALASVPATADLYRWVDAKGVVNYSNIPPQGVKATQIPETQPTVSVIPLPEQRPEVQQAQREAELLRRIVQLENELSAMRTASTPTVIYPVPVPVPSATYTVPIVYPFAVNPWPVFKHGGGHRFHTGGHRFHTGGHRFHTGGHRFHTGGHRFHSRHHRMGQRGNVKGSPPVAGPHGRHSGLAVRARF